MPIPGWGGGTQAWQFLMSVPISTATTVRPEAVLPNRALFLPTFRERVCCLLVLNLVSSTLQLSMKRTSHTTVINDKNFIQELHTRWPHPLLPSAPSDARASSPAVPPAPLPSFWMTCSHDVRCHDNKKLITIGSRPVFASSFSTGPPGDRGVLHCLWNARNTTRTSAVVAARGGRFIPSKL